MREYVASFNDGHVFIEGTPIAPQLPARWPGFFTREIRGKHVVGASAGVAGLPALGAELISCDGVEAEQLAADLVGRFRGRWRMSSQHDAHAWRLFLDAENPFVKMPKSCVFSNGEIQQSYKLSWLPLTVDELQEESAKVSGVFRAPTKVRQFGSHGLWISMGSFNGDVSTEQGKQVSALIKELERDKGRLAAAKVIVLDVRGNGGGSSRWGNEIARLVWGKKVSEAAKPKSGGIEWRVSKANIAAVEEYGKSPGMGFFTRMFMGQVVAGLKAALAAGKPLWQEKAPPRMDLDGSRLVPGASAGSRKVYILTDGGCASACLDAMDVWTRAGAIPIGRETAADSLYMEIRKQALPSGLATISVPMKVYRGRPRGLNATYKPVHQFNGDPRDEEAVEAWVASLPSL
jgi:hypothetical protein